MWSSSSPAVKLAKYRTRITQARNEGNYSTVLAQGDRPCLSLPPLRDPSRAGAGGGWGAEAGTGRAMPPQGSWRCRAFAVTCPVPTSVLLPLLQALQQQVAPLASCYAIAPRYPVLTTGLVCKHRVLRGADVACPAAGRHEEAAHRLTSLNRLREREPGQSPMLLSLMQAIAAPFLGSCCATPRSDLACDARSRTPPFLSTASGS
eukprot:125670-Rhodomonas_salina.1